MSSVVLVLRFTIDEQPYALPIRDDAMLGLTPREHQRVSALAGVRGVQAIADAVQQMDVPTLTALAIVAAERAGQKPDADAVFDSTALTFDADLPDDPPPVGGAADAPPSTSTTPTTLEATGTP